MLADIEVWALPINTGLLIILALVNTFIVRRQNAEKRDLTDLKRKMGANRRWSDEGNDEHRPDTGERRRVGDRRGDRRERR